MAETESHRVVASSQTGQSEGTGTRRRRPSLSQAVKRLALRLAKAAGLFALARHWTARDLRILCYHGAALRDEHSFRPGLFITAETFAERMRFLVERGYPVLELDEALRLMAKGALPRWATVITIDDGWYGTYRLIAPVLKRLGLPATLYLATSYMERQAQVFDVAAAYAIWRAGEGTLDLSAVSPGLGGTFSLADQSQRDAACQALSDHASALATAGERQALLRRLCRVLGLRDWAEIERDRVAAYMDEGEARELVAMGIDLQLHTHRHRFPDDSPEAAAAEIEANRRALSRLTNRPLNHFCYPSGQYTKGQLPLLERLGIASATTTRPGFNRSGTPRHELRRFLDSDALSLIEFEAEISGFRELFRSRAA
jgi:peptidoglycan/xylan/chitin deacetylase (PgdA/CDA1 family)